MESCLRLISDKMKRMMRNPFAARSFFRKLATLTIALAAFIVAPVATLAADPTIDDFLQEAHIRDAKLSPDGKHLALIIREPERRLVIVRNLEQPDMPIVGVNAEETLQPARLAWGSNDRLLITLWIPWGVFDEGRLRGGSSEFDESIGFSRMVAMNVDMSDQAFLMEGDRGLRKNYSLSRVNHFLPNDDDHILMAAYRSGKRTLYKVNIRNGKAEMITKGSPRTFRFLSADDGTPLYRFDYRERKNILEFFAYEGDDDWAQIGQVQLNRDEEDRFDSSELVSLIDGDLVYRKQSDQSGFYELVRIDGENSSPQVLAAREGQDVHGALFHPRSDQIVGYTLEKDNVRNVYFDESRQRQYDAIAASIGRNNFTVSSLDRSIGRALVTVSGPDVRRIYYLWNFDSQTLSYLGNAYPELPPGALSKPTVKDYAARDGTRLRAYLLLPQSYKAGEQYPTVILPHGGPQSRDRAEFDLLAQFLSTRGYIVVQPNFRGSVGYGRDFEQAGYRQYGGLMQDDVTDVTTFMIENGYSDPERICIVGGSYGGYAALMGAVKTPDLYACAVSINGVTHLEDMVKYDMKELVEKADWDELIFSRVGHPKDDRALLDANSPALNADRISIPVLLLAGTEDERVPFKQSKQMAKALEKADVEHQFIPIDGAGHHVFRVQDDSELVLETIGDFLAEHLD